MIAENQIQLRELFEGLFEDPLLDEMCAKGRMMKVKAGDILMDIGVHFKEMPLLINGAIKIFREDKDGKELLLYYLEAGDTCAMSLSCCMGKKKSRIRAVAEDQSLLLMLPVELMDDWISTYPSWKSYVFDSMQIRMDELLDAIDTIAFLKMDKRLMKYLKDKAIVHSSLKVQTTHREIAEELNTSRVVISRILKKLEISGLIEVGRTQIELLEFK